MAFNIEEIGGGLLVTFSQTGGVGEGANEGVGEGVNGLYLLIKKNEGNRVPFFAKVLNTSEKNIERWLKQLKQDKKIEFRGAPKTGGYYPTEN